MLFRSLVLSSLLFAACPVIASYAEVIASTQSLVGIVEEDDQDLNNIESVSGILAAEVFCRLLVSHYWNKTFLILCRKSLRTSKTLVPRSRELSMVIKALRLALIKGLRIN